jgi:nuclear pore complex protein Nup160
MTTSYTPHRLVHAHLPSPPLIPYSIPELRVPTSRTFSESSTSDSQLLHPDHATSIHHDAATNILARVLNNGTVLELRTLSLVSPGNGKAKSGGIDTVRIFFPDPLRSLSERCIIHSRRHRRVYILVVTQSNVLYRLNFDFSGDPIGRNGGDRMDFSVGSGSEWCEEWQVPDEVIAGCGGVGSWTVVNENMVVLGGGDGGIVRLIRQESNSSGMFRR